MPLPCGQRSFEILRLVWPMRTHMLTKRFRGFEMEGLGGAAYWVATLDLSTVQPEVYQRGSGRRRERSAWEACKTDAIARWRKCKVCLGSADVTGSCVDGACRGSLQEGMQASRRAHGRHKISWGYQENQRSPIKPLARRLEHGQVCAH